MPAFPPSLGELISSYFKRHSVGWVLLKSFFFYNVMVFTTPMQFSHRWWYRFHSSFYHFLNANSKNNLRAPYQKNQVGQSLLHGVMSTGMNRSFKAKFHIFLFLFGFQFYAFRGKTLGFTCNR